jgi:hypothetical protein
MANQIPDKIPLRMTFEGEWARRFVIVKNDKGVRHNTELIRVLVSEAYIDFQKRNQLQPVSKSPAKD